MTSHLRFKYRKLATISLLLAFGSAFIATQARTEDLLETSTNEEGLMSLRSDILVNAEFVTLGDLFHLTGSKSEINVVRAPKPGSRLSIPSPALARFVYRKGLQWDNAMQLRQVYVTRSSAEIHEDDIRGVLELAFDDMGIEGPMDIKFHERDLTIHQPTGTTPDLTIESLSHDPVSGRFVAKVRTPLDNNETLLTTVSGQTIEVQIIPVLARSISRGDIITASDLKTERVPLKRIGTNIIAQMDDVVGMQTKRALRPGDPLRSTDLKAPTMIEKGALISMTFAVPGIKLTNVGRALEAGGAGDIINVINPRSRQTVMARIVSQNQVSVELTSIQIASAQ